MTNIEQKALELVNEVQAERNHAGSPWNSPTILNEALYRAIEQHERFRQEVSDAVESLCNTVFVYEEYLDMRDMLRRRFIIAKPDPLVEVLNEMIWSGCRDVDANTFRAALAKRGLEIREKSDD